MFSSSTYRIITIIITFIYNHHLTQASDAIVSEDAQVLHETTSFYKDYVAKYYPRVFVIRDIFAKKMKPAEVAEAIGTIIHVFTEKPWFYFFDDNKTFKLSHYWEFILDQTSFLHEFLKLARVNLETLEIFLPSEHNDLANNYFNVYLGKEKPKKTIKTEPLLTHLRKQKYPHIAEFYAFNFDFLIKLFNEHIMFKNIIGAESCLYELTYIMDQIKLTHFKQSVVEIDYVEALETAKQLVTILKSQHRYEQSLFSTDSSLLD